MTNAGSTCGRCGKPRTFNDRHDAFYCAECDVWLEPKCSDPGCAPCTTRPERPSAAAHDDDWVDEPPGRQ